ncbi:MAG TPA: hypothetical protein DD640_03665 [Clostridiales bacterium]|nr:hypothetical protein [Clostridiales bacterium]
MLKLLGSGSGLVSWHQLAGKYGSPEAVASDIYSAADQLRYGWYLLEQGDRRAFQEWWLGFRAGYRTESGAFRVKADDAAAAAADSGFWRSNQMTARLLAQSCSAWPDAQRLDDLFRLSDQLLESHETALASDYLANVPTSAPIPDPAATPTPKPTASPAADKPRQTAVLRLSSIDLFAMQQLVQIDPRWQVLAGQYLKVVEDGYLGDSLPLYALAYDQAQDGYLPFAGDAPVVNTEEAMLVMLHLCEISRLDPHSMSWLREQIFNEKALYEFYHITQGTAASAEECLPAYAMAARIARIQGDRDLYAAAADLLLWHRATNQRSPALNAIFRENADGLVRVTAIDNTWALLALR